MKTTINFRVLTRDAETFGEMLSILTEQGGLPRGRSILLARQLRPRLYNKWMVDRQAGRITEKRGGRSILSHFKIIGG